MARDLAVTEVIPVQLAELMTMAASPTPSPTPSLDPKVLETDPITTIAAIVAIVFALAAAFIGYRIIRGGRGL